MTERDINIARENTLRTTETEDQFFFSYLTLHCEFLSSSAGESRRNWERWPENFGIEVQRECQKFPIKWYEKEK